MRTPTTTIPAAFFELRLWPAGSKEGAARRSFYLLVAVHSPWPCSGSWRSSSPLKTVLFGGMTPAGSLPARLKTTEVCTLRKTFGS
jgi:hypothetical protein